MAKALVVYATRTRQTQKIGELIAEGMRMDGLEVTVANVNEIEKKGIKLDDYDILVLGSATYHGERGRPVGCSPAVYVDHGEIEPTP